MSPTAKQPSLRKRIRRWLKPFWHKTPDSLRDLLNGTVRFRMHALSRDRANRRRYGPEAPLFGERIWIDPQTCTHQLHVARWTSSGRVFEEELDESKIVPVERNSFVAGSIAHWRDGKSWAETGLYDRLFETVRRSPGSDRCYTYEDVVARYERLDRMFERVKEEGRLRTQAEVNRWAFREVGGILIHLGPEGVPYFGRAGQHRFGMALALGLRIIPATIGMVHISALPHLERYRRGSALP